MVWLKDTDTDLSIRLNPLEKFASFFHKDMRIPLAGITSVEVTDQPLAGLDEQLDYVVKQPPKRIGTIEWYRLAAEAGSCFVSVYLPYRQAIVVRSKGSAGVALAVITQRSADQVAERLRAAVAAAHGR